MTTRRFCNETVSVGEARQFTRETLNGTPQEQLEIIELLVSELATNCIRHARADFQVAIHRTAAEIRVEVTDHTAGEPVVRSPGPEDPTGRGLQIVQMLSRAWGVEHKDKVGKTVWFTLATPRPDTSPTSTPQPTGAHGPTKTAQNKPRAKPETTQPEERDRRRGLDCRRMASPSGAVRFRIAVALRAIPIAGGITNTVLHRSGRRARGFPIPRGCSFAARLVVG
jgi:anti-sigma regulatory factor (Ser/Thr protein kinase)